MITQDDDERPGATPTCSARDCDSKEHAHFVRFLFSLPATLPVQEMHRTVHVYGDPLTPGSEAAIAVVTIRQVTLDTELDTIPPSLAAASLVGERLGILVPDVPGRIPSPGVSQIRSVADVITTRRSPAVPPEGHSGEMRDLLPNEDAFMRALHAVRTVARSLQLVGSAPAATLPTYERINSMVYWFEDILRGDEGEPFEISDVVARLQSLAWQDQGLMILEHDNIEFTGASEPDPEATAQWSLRIACHEPSALARERFIEAKRLLYRDGEYGTAVAMVCTAIETLCDAILSCLLWEERWGRGDVIEGLSEAAQIMGGEAPLRRATAELPPRLGGDWSSSGSSWKVFRDGAALLRNRVLHAGYEPRFSEARRALDEAFEAQSFMIERIAVRAGQYPRVAFLFLGKDALGERGLLTGKVKKFFAETAPVETNYVEHFALWHRSAQSRINNG